MSIVPQGLASFPGVEQLLDASISIAQGISPSSARLTIAPQMALPAEVGTLAVTFGGVTVAFPDCKIDHGTIERTTRGEVCQLSILDRRWRWRFGRISGTYNVRRDDCSLERGQQGAVDTERTPQELATLCLQAMGESNFDVADLPNQSRPSVEWDDEVPAEALAGLCDVLGCRVVLQLDNRVAIRRAGQGAVLPPGAALQVSATINVPERPDAIAVVGGPNRYQVDFPLEAVGLTGNESPASESLVPVDDLGYRPPGGWSRVDLPYFHQVDVASRTLAQKSVFRYYRIRTPVVVPGYNGPDGDVVNRLEQILPIEDEQVTLGAESGRVGNRPATVFGIWHPDPLEVANSASALRPIEEQEESDSSIGPVYRRPFTIDTARGLVIFDEPVYRNVHASASGGSGYELVIGAAELVLRATCSVRDRQTLAPLRYTRVRNTGANHGTAPRWLKHDEIVLAHKPRYSEHYALLDVDSSAAEADRESDFYLDAAEQEYEVSTPQTIRYCGLVPVELDGAIGQVSFSIGPAGTTTTAVRNNESPLPARSYQQMRRMERWRATEGVARRLSPRNLARWLKINPHAKPRP
jgi:hypothetical protein